MLTKWRLSRLLSLSIFFIVLFIITGMIFVDYLVVVNTAREDTRIIRVHSEEMVNTTFQLINTGLELYDNTFNNEMLNGFAITMDAYNQTDGDIARMDLKKLSRKLGMDVHIINQSAVITESSNYEEKGLNFSVIYPDFAIFLKKIINKSGFYPDRVVMEYYTGNLTKYAYMPTPDHQYIIELALQRKEFNEDRMRLKYDIVMDQIKRSNPDIEQYRIFAKNYRLLYNNTYNLTENERTIVSRILTERKNLEFSGINTDHTIKYVFVDMIDEQYGADMSLITEIVYDNSRMRDRINNLFRYHIILAIIAITSGALLSLLIANRLSRPLELMVEDIDHIADGNLNHPIRTGFSIELRKLQESNIRLVTSIRTLIEDLKEEEKKLHTSEERYRAVVETQNELISRFDKERKLFFVNDAYCRFFGIPTDNILGSRFEPSMPEEDMSRVSEFLESLTKDNPRGTIEHRTYAGDGCIRWFQWSYTAIFSDDGEFTEYQSVGRDITTLKILEESLQASDNLYRTTINAMVDGVHVIDQTYTILLINKGFDPWLRFVAVDRTSIVNTNLFTAFPFLSPKVREEYEEVFSSGKVLITSESTILGEEEIHTETRKIPIHIDGKCEKIVTIVRDITEKKRAEQAQQNMNLLLEEEVKIRTKELEDIVFELDSFTYTVSHDLRGPIRAVDGFAHILGLKLESSNKSEFSYYIGKIHDNIRLMDQLIEDLLMFSRMSRHPLTRAPINMTALASDVVREMRTLYPLIRYDITISELPSALGDAMLVRQVLVNLISNAMKFSQKQHEPKIEIKYSFNQEGTGEYQVRDNGIGFDMQYADKIFDVFQRLHLAGEYEGTGVGLAIVNRIIIRHGGNIRVVSKEGAGAEFSFTLGVEHGA